MKTGTLLSIAIFLASFVAAGATSETYETSGTSETTSVTASAASAAASAAAILASCSAGGQKGLGSIIEHLGTDAFPRIKIGVGDNPSRDYDMAAWVLGRLPEEDMKAVALRLEDVLGCIKMILGAVVFQH